MHAGRPEKLPRVLPAVFLGAGLALVSSAQQPISQQDAVTAGQLAGFRAVLAARHNQSSCDLTDADVHEQDSAAERLFFGRYNPNYRGRGTQGTAQFLDIARQTQAAVSQHPENYDLTGVCQAVLKEIAAFHPNVPRRSTEAAAVYCATWKGQSASTYSCSGTRFPQALGGTDLFQNRTFQLRHVTAYTGYCLGRTLDGILFQPTGTSQGQWCSERARFQFSYDWLIALAAGRVVRRRVANIGEALDGEARIVDSTHVPAGKLCRCCQIDPMNGVAFPWFGDRNVPSCVTVHLSLYVAMPRSVVCKRRIDHIGGLHRALFGSGDPLAHKV